MNMGKYKDVCKMTLKPLQWVSDPKIVTERCIHGECKDCTKSYVGKGKTNALYQGQDLWPNVPMKESELAVYGGALWIMNSAK